MAIDMKRGFIVFAVLAFVGLACDKAFHESAQESAREGGNEKRLLHLESEEGAEGHMEEAELAPAALEEVEGHDEVGALGRALSESLEGGAPRPASNASARLPGSAEGRQQAAKRMRAPKRPERKEGPEEERAVLQEYAKETAFSKGDGLDLEGALPSALQAGLPSRGLGTGGAALGTLSEREDMRFQKPGRFLPRQLYFENTYLGGKPSYKEALRRLKESLSEEEAVVLEWGGRPPSLAAPQHEGMAMDLRLSRSYWQAPERMFLEIELRGSESYGWRRSGLDLMVVLDPRFLRDDENLLSDFVLALFQKLGKGDRLGFVLAGEGVKAGEANSMPLPLKEAQRRFASHFEDWPRDASFGSMPDMAHALNLARESLLDPRLDEAHAPGSKFIYFVTGKLSKKVADESLEAIQRASAEGVSTSLFLWGGQEARDSWPLAEAGQGNLRSLTRASYASEIDEELHDLVRVVARLLRLNLDLGKDTHLVRILGSRVLSDAEKAAVKAQEKAIDQELSERYGLISDRGEDGGGIETVIPYFYGGDSHRLILELWIEKPGKVLDLSLKYKDMLKLENGSIRQGLYLQSSPRDEGFLEAQIAQGLEDYKLYERLSSLEQALKNGDREGLLLGARAWRSDGAEDKSLLDEGQMALQRSLLAWAEGRGQHSKEALLDWLEVSRKSLVGGGMRAGNRAGLRSP